MLNIKFYGGPLHGREMSIGEDEDRISCYDKRFRAEMRNIYSDVPMTPSLMAECPYDKVTYQINMWHERVGIAQRSTRIAVLEGSKLLRHEEYEVQRDMSYLPWSPIREISFLKDFERWWAWCLYRHTGNEYPLLQAERVYP